MESFDVETAARFVRKYYSTTSSLYIHDTNPCVEQILFCVASVLQAGIFESLDQMRPTCQAEFDIIPDLKPEQGGECWGVTEAQAKAECCDDEDFQRELMLGNVPTIDTVARFLSYVHQFLCPPWECNIIALMYVNRILQKGSLVLTRQNWRMVWVLALDIAQKVWNDLPAKSIVFESHLPPLTVRQFRRLEGCTLSLLDYETTVRPAQYARMYFELHSLFQLLVPQSKCKWPAKPLTMRSTMILEDRCRRKLSRRPKDSNMSSSESAKSSVSVTISVNDVCPAGCVDVKEIKEAELVTLPSLGVHLPSSRLGSPKDGVSDGSNGRKDLTLTGDSAASFSLLPSISKSSSPSQSPPSGFRSADDHCSSVERKRAIFVIS